MAGRDKNATWRTLGSLCRDRDWSKPRALHELQNGLEYRTFPKGHTVDWHHPEVKRTLDVEASTVTVILGALDLPGTVGIGVETVTLGIEVLPPNDAEAPAPSTPVRRWRKRPAVKDLKVAALAVAKTYQPDDPPTESDWWEALNIQLGEPVSRKVARDALATWAQNLQRKPGQKRDRRS